MDAVVKQSAGARQKEIKARLVKIKKLRSALKDELKVWIDDFTAAHSRAPSDSDKAPVKSKFVERAALEKESVSLKAELEKLKKSLRSPSSSAAPSTPPPLAVAEKFSIANMRARRAVWSKDRLKDIQKELDMDDSDLTGEAKKVSPACLGRCFLCWSL